MVKSAWWRDWLEGGPLTIEGCQRFLWIHGLPGSGKTILASYLVDQVGRHCTSRGYSYYYCSYVHNRDETIYLLQWIVRDLTSQLGRCVPEGYIPRKLHGMRRRRAKTVPDLLCCLQEITSEFSARFSKRVYIVIDGVDESNLPRTQLLQVLTAIGSNPEFENISLLITSRDYPDIRGTISDLPRQVMRLRNASVNNHPTRARTQYQAATPSPVPVLWLVTGNRHDNPSNESPPLSSNRDTGWTVDSRPSRVPRSTNVDMDGDDTMEMTVGMRQGLNRTPSPTKRSAPGGQRAREPSPRKRKTSAGGSHVDVSPERDREDSPSPDVPVIPCNILSMSNNFVKKAIETFIQQQLNKSERFAQWPRPEFIEKLKIVLAAKAGGMFRTVACHLDMIERLDLTDEPSILNEINSMPGIIFEMYEKIIIDGIIPREAGDRSKHNKEFARTALALICSDTSLIPDAGVLVEAARRHVPQSIAQDYNFKKLVRLLGCLVRVSTLRRKPRSAYRRDDDDDSNGSRLHLKRFALAHYTVKEYLYHKKTAEGPARDFALSNETNQILELTVVFYGLRNYCTSGIPKRTPTRFDEYCLRMTDKALISHPVIAVKVEDVWRAVFPCLAWNAAHQGAIRNKVHRDAFPTWARLAAAFEDGLVPEQMETCILVSLILLEWPALAEVYLETLSSEAREKVWKDKFSLREDNDKTVLQMVVSRRSFKFLEVIVKAGATFMGEPDILFRAMEDPYGNDENCNPNPTRILLTTLLDRGANPDPPGFKFTPLQLAVRYIEPRWVGVILASNANPDVVGDTRGILPPGHETDRAWHRKTPMEMCCDGTIRIEREAFEGEDGEVSRNRRRVRELLRQHKNHNVIVEIHDDE